MILNNGTWRDSGKYSQSFRVGGPKQQGTKTSGPNCGLEVSSRNVIYPDHKNQLKVKYVL